VIESITNPESVEKKPWKAFVAAFIMTIVAGLLAMNVSTASGGSGLLVIAFISIAAAPFFVQIFRIEEMIHEGNLFQRHRRVIEIYFSFFAAVALATSLLYIAMPEQTANGLFSDQVKDLESKGVIASSGAAVHVTYSFATILTNNLYVLLLAFVFSFMLGAGAVFEISWNASIIGVLIGKIAAAPAAFGAITIIPGNAVANYIVALPFTILTILPHGILEFGAYFFGAVAGGILSVAIVQESIRTWKHYQPILKDALAYLMIAVVLVLAGAAIEVVI